MYTPTRRTSPRQGVGGANKATKKTKKQEFKKRVGCARYDYYSLYYSTFCCTKTKY